jgi:hypothetical protein
MRCGAGELGLSLAILGVVAIIIFVGVLVRRCRKIREQQV